MTEHSETKEKILKTIRMRGPSLPVHIAKEINQSILFTSAFLSEILAEKELKMSYLRVGSSPIYFIPGQEKLLERFSPYLKSKEKDAFTLLKERKFLKDSEQESAIGVALRAIKDFAIPFNYDDELFWKYLTASDSEFAPPRRIIEEESAETEEKESIPEEESSETEKKLLDIFEENNKNEKQKKITKEIKKSTEKKKSDGRKLHSKKIIKKKISKKTDEKFFNRVKEYLAKNLAEILDIENFGRNELSLKVRINEQEKLVVAYNKKRITEEDITNAYKKSSNLNVPYIILGLGEPSKKIINFIEAIKNLETIETIE